MSTAIATVQPLGVEIEKVLIGGDLSPLTPDQRLSYYNRICESLGLNALTKPFAYITLNGKLTLYALKDCTEQLRKIHGVSITSVDPKQIGDLLVVVAAAQDREGRVDSSTGAVNVKGVTGENLANAMMKCETKAKRRVTLSLCGLGMLDETEIDTLKEQGVASDPGMNKWEAPPATVGQAEADVPRGTSGVISHNSPEPDIRPKSQRGAQTPTQAPPTPPAAPESQGGAVQGTVVEGEPTITGPQAKRFFAIMRSAEVSEEDCKARLAKLGFHGHRDGIPKRLYEAAVDAIDPQLRFHQNKPKGQ